MSVWPSSFLYRDCICGASSWHKSKLAFVNFSAPSHPSVYGLPYLPTWDDQTFCLRPSIPANPRRPILLSTAFHTCQPETTNPSVYGLPYLPTRDDQSFCLRPSIPANPRWPILLSTAFHTCQPETTNPSVYGLPYLPTWDDQRDWDFWTEISITLAVPRGLDNAVVNHIMSY